MVEPPVVGRAVHDARLLAPERRRTAAVEVQRRIQPQLPHEIDQFADRHTRRLPRETAVHDDHHRLAPSRDAHDRTGVPAPETALAIGIRQRFAAAEKQRPGSQRVTVTPREPRVVRRNIGFDPHAAPLYRHHAVDAELFPSFGRGDRPASDTHERRGNERLHIEIARVHGRHGPLRLGQNRRKRQRIRLYDAGAVSSRVIPDHRDRLRRAEQFELRLHGHQMRPHAAGIPADRGDRQRILHALRTGRNGQAHEQPTEHTFHSFRSFHRNPYFPTKYSETPEPSVSRDVKIRKSEASASLIMPRQSIQGANQRYSASAKS